jgi:predicted ATPase
VRPRGSSAAREETKIARLARQRDTLPVLLLITFRPEFEPPWIGQPYVTALILNRLTRHEVHAMIDRVAGNKQLPGNVRQDIIERTDGIPLFVEEMTKAVVEAESHSDAERAAAAIPSAAVAVPATLRWSEKYLRELLPPEAACRVHPTH